MDPTGSDIYIYTFLINILHRQFRNTDRHNTRNSESSIPFKKSNPPTHPSRVLRHCVATLSTGALAKTYDCAGTTRPKFSSLYWNCGGADKGSINRGRSNSSLRQVSGPELIEGQPFDTVFATYSGRTEFFNWGPFKSISDQGRRSRSNRSTGSSSQTSQVIQRFNSSLRRAQGLS